MKKLYLGALFHLMCLTPLSLLAQLNNGGINALFGIDGDTRGNYVKYGPSTGSIVSDDWFSTVPSGVSLIDTSNASFYSALLQSGANVGFFKRMGAPLYSKVNGKLWLDAVYGRDYVCTSPLFDSTIFTIAAKNGDNPINWLGGTSNTPDKNDLVDVYAHMRRDGTSVYDSLWLFTGVSTVGTSGSRYFDIELYKKNFSYSSSTGTFTTAGTEAGHTQWLFDAAGNITQTGDMILAVNYTPGSPPVVDLRIWVSRVTYNNVTPARFNFGPTLDGSSLFYGYTSILSKAGTTSFGSGIANYSATPAQDTTYSTPWGTEQSTKVWGAQYQTLQLVEIGLNLTRIGLDPALYTSLGLNPCTSLFSDIFFKSRSSNSFVSNMQDFVTPLQFLRPPVMDYTLKPDTLRCNRSLATIQLTNNSTVGTYSWKTLSGNIAGSNADSSQLSINKAGTYVVTSTPAIGCPPTRIDTVVIPIDTFPPVASINATVGSNYSYLQLYGGDVAASNYMTPFGGSQGLLWNWTGPNAFTSTVQNPLTDTAWGQFQLVVTEKRNGCTDTARKTLNIWDFSVLAALSMNLNGKVEEQSILLNWQSASQLNAAYFIVQKSADGANFAPIGNIYPKQDSAVGSYSFRDVQPFDGSSYYRIEAVSKDGKLLYSNTIQLGGPVNDQKFNLIRNYGGNQLALVIRSDKDQQAALVVYNVLGQVYISKSVHLSPGTNIIQIQPPSSKQHAAIVVSLYSGNQLSFSQKVVL